LDSKSNVIRRETAIRTEPEHSFVTTPGHDISSNSAIVTEFVGNGSLASAYQSQPGLIQGKGIVKVIAGVALAMRFLHGRSVVHYNLTPGKILLDYDWSVKIANFGGSVFPDERAVPCQASINPRYRARECYDGTFFCASNVFAFGLVPSELLMDSPVFPESRPSRRIAYLVAVEHARSEIPDFVFPALRNLITDVRTSRGPNGGDGIQCGCKREFGETEELCARN
jgi:serine/threonine protein kinase